MRTWDNTDGRGSASAGSGNSGSAGQARGKPDGMAPSVLTVPARAEPIAAAGTKPVQTPAWAEPIAVAGTKAGASGPGGWCRGPTRCSPIPRLAAAQQRLGRALVKQAVSRAQEAAQAGRIPPGRWPTRRWPGCPPMRPHWSR